MWPFRKVTTDEFDVIENTIVMARYTEETWKKLFDDSAMEDWLTSTSPNNISKFVSNTIVGYANELKNNVSEIIIATIDNEYIEWLKKYNLTHSQGVLTKYIQRCTKKKNYWDERLFESGMTLTCNMLGVPVLGMPPIKTRKTDYVLSDETKQNLSLYLSAMYGNEDVYCPGWIVKGNEMIECVDDVLFVADHYWRTNSNIRIGKYLEQNHTEKEMKEKFSPILYIVPFVVKANVESATISLKDVENGNSKTLQFMNKFKYSKVQKVEMMEMVAKDVPSIIAIGSNSVLPNQAYFHYFSKNKKLN